MADADKNQRSSRPRKDRSDITLFVSGLPICAQSAGYRKALAVAFKPHGGSRVKVLPYVTRDRRTRNVEAPHGSGRLFEAAFKALSAT